MAQSSLGVQRRHDTAVPCPAGRAATPYSERAPARRLSCAAAASAGQHAAACGGDPDEV